MKRIIRTLLFSLICASCATIDDLLPPIEIGSPVTFSSSMENGSPLVSPASGIGTRVSGTSWHIMDSVGIYMYPADNGLAASTYSNKLYYAPSEGSKVNLIPDSESETIYYPLDDSETVKFTAYYPYTETINNHIFPISLSDQRTLLKHIRTDLLWHQGSTAYSGSSSAVHLSFAHQLSKVTIRLTPSASLSGIDLSGTIATLAGVPTTGSFSLATGALSNLSGADNAIRTYRKAAAMGETTFEAIVLPHVGTAYGSRTANFTVNGKAYVYDIPDSQTFLPGHHYTFEFALTTTGLILINNSITDWVEGVVTSSAPGANSYIVAPGGDWTLIPISRAKYYSDTYDNTHPVIESGETFYAGIVWSDATSVVQDIEVVGTGPNGFIKVVSGNTPGNAIVALKKKVGDSYEILWSWHIWVVDYEPNINAIFMDRNLGAISANPEAGVATFGLFYQWGRKDPFPGSASMEVESGEEPVLYGSVGDGFQYGMNTNIISELGYPTCNYAKENITWSIQHPITFISTSGSWFPDSTTSDDPWGYNAGKTLYDPCPEGWRVPKEHWEGLSSAAFPWSDSNRGCFNSSYGGWYPANGFRINSGGLRDVGTEGHCWYARLGWLYKEKNAACMDFNPMSDGSTSLSLDTAIGRSYGLSVRCVQDEM